MRVVQTFTRFVHPAVLPYLLILSLCGFLLVRAYAIPGGPDGQLGADIWPKTILLLAAGTCVWEVLRNLWTTDIASHVEPGPAVVDEHEPEDRVPPWLPWVAIALTGVYVLLLQEIGYFLATFAFTAVFIYVGNYRRPLAALVTGAIAALAFVFIFMKVVYVALPLGHEPFARLSAFIMELMGIR